LLGEAGTSYSSRPDSFQFAKCKVTRGGTEIKKVFGWGVTPEFFG